MTKRKLDAHDLYILVREIDEDGRARTPVDSMKMWDKSGYMDYVGGGLTKEGQSLVNRLVAALNKDVGVRDDA